MVAKLHGNCVSSLMTASHKSLPVSSQTRLLSQAPCKQAQSSGIHNASTSVGRSCHWSVAQGRKKGAPTAEVWERLRTLRHDDSRVATGSRVGSRGCLAPHAVKKVEAEVGPLTNTQVVREELTSLLPSSVVDAWDQSPGTQVSPWNTEAGKGGETFWNTNLVFDYQRAVNLQDARPSSAGLCQDEGGQARSQARDTEHQEIRPPDKLPFSVNLTTQQSILLMNLLSFGYGANAVLVKLMQDHETSQLTVPASTQITVDFFARFVVATLCFLPPTLARHRAIRKQQQQQQVSIPDSVQMNNKASKPASGRGPWQKLSGLIQGFLPGIELGLWMFLSYAGQTIGLESSTADHAELLATVAVIMVPFLEAFGGVRPISKPVWIATFVACSGMLLLEGGPSLAHAQSLSDSAAGFTGWSVPAGDWWCLLSAVCAAIHVVRAEVLIAKHDSLWLVTSQLAFTSVASIGWLAWEVNTQHIPIWNLPGCLPAVPWAIILLTGPLGTGMCEWLELEALHHVPASTATLITTTVPIWGCILAYFLLGETLDATSMGGAFLILLASINVQLWSSNTSEENAHDVPSSKPPTKESVRDGATSALLPAIVPLAIANVEEALSRGMSRGMSSDFSLHGDRSLSFAPARAAVVIPARSDGRVSTSQTVTLVGDDGVVGLDAWSQKFDPLADLRKTKLGGVAGKSDVGDGELAPGKRVRLLSSSMGKQTMGATDNTQQRQDGGASHAVVGQPLTRRWRGGSQRNARRR